MNIDDHFELLKKLCNTLESAYRQSLRNIKKLDAIKSSVDEPLKPYIDPSLSAGNLLFELRKRNN